MKRFQLALTLVAAIALAGNVVAQRRDVNSTAFGEGRFTLNGKRFDLKQGQLNLRKDGDAEFAIIGERGWRFSGSYDRIVGNTVRINVKNGPGNRASGTLVATISERGRVETMEGSGGSGDGGWSVTFNSETIRTADNDDRRKDDRPGDSWKSVDEVRYGTGRIFASSDQTRLSKASVRLMKDGSAELVLTGQSRDFRFRGDWKREGNEFVINFTDGLGSSKTTGKATIQIRESDIRDINVSGKDGNGRIFTASFRPERKTEIVPDKNPDRNPDRDEWTDSKETRKGVGLVRNEKGDRGDLDRAMVEMNRDGTFRIQVDGERAYKIAGTWKRLSNDSAELKITSGLGSTFGSGDATGTGRVWFKNGVFTSIEFKTKSDGFDRTFTFKAN